MNHAKIKKLLLVLIMSVLSISAILVAIIYSPHLKEEATISSNNNDITSVSDNADDLDFFSKNVFNINANICPDYSGLRVVDNVVEVFKGNVYNYRLPRINLLLKSNTQYTMSFEVKASENVKARIRFVDCLSDYGFSLNDDFNVTSYYVSHVITFTTPDMSNYNYLALGYMSFTSNPTIFYSNIQIEEGNIATDYVPFAAVDNIQNDGFLDIAPNKNLLTVNSITVHDFALSKEYYNLKLPDLTHGELVTVSFLVYFNNNQNADLLLFLSDCDNYIRFNDRTVLDNSNGKSYVSFTFRYNSDFPYLGFSYRSKARAWNSMGVDNLKLELGSVCTPFVPYIKVNEFTSDKSYNINADFNPGNYIKNSFLMPAPNFDIRNGVDFVLDKNLVIDTTAVEGVNGSLYSANEIDTKDLISFPYDKNIYKKVYEVMSSKMYYSYFSELNTVAYSFGSMFFLKNDDGKYYPIWHNHEDYFALLLQSTMNVELNKIMNVFLSSNSVNERTVVSYYNFDILNANKKFTTWYRMKKQPTYQVNTNLSNVQSVKQYSSDASSFVIGYLGRTENGHIDNEVSTFIDLNTNASWAQEFNIYSLSFSGASGSDQVRVPYFAFIPQSADGIIDYSPSSKIFGVEYKDCKWYDVLGHLNNALYWILNSAPLISDVAKFANYGYIVVKESLGSLSFILQLGILGSILLGLIFLIAIVRFSHA